MPNPSEIINLVPLLRKNQGEQFLTDMGARVVEDFNNDKQSRRVWEENVATDLKLFTSFMEGKSDQSNIILPVMAIACLQYQARAYDALIPARDIVSVIATGDEDIERADRTSKFMNYQLHYQMEEFEEGMDKSLMLQPIVGCVFRKTYFDPSDKRNHSDYINAQDLVVNYTTKSTIEEAERKTHILYHSVNDLRVRAKNLIYDQFVWDLGPGSMTFLNAGNDIIRRTMDESQGIKPPTQFDDKNRIILEQHRGWDIDGDGIEEPLVITVDYETNRVTRITDRRFYDAFGRERVIEYFTKYGFIPNPNGFYDIGFGTLIRGLNAGCNKIVNEVIDAGELANLQGGFVAKRSGIKRGQLKFKMGEYKEVDAYVDDINKAIYHMDFKGPNQTLYAVLGLLYEYSKLVSSVSETMTGQMPASDTSGMATMALMEEGKKVFSTIQKRNHRSFKREIKKLFRLNSIFLDEREYFKALGDSNIPQGQNIQIGKSDFIDTADVIPISDPNITSKTEKIMIAQQVFQLTVSSPATNSNQTAINEAHARVLEALGAPNKDALMPPPEIPDLSPEQENANFITNKPANALPTQDHVYHLTIHNEFMEGSFAVELTPEAVKMAESHRRDHVAFIYLISKQQVGQGV